MRLPLIAARSEPTLSWIPFETQSETTLPETALSVGAVLSRTMPFRVYPPHWTVLDVIETPGEDAVFGVRFMPIEHPRTWEDLLSADKDLGQRWAIELLRRGILVNPNEKFYISIAHTDADVDVTLEAVEAAFAELSRTR